MGTTLPSIVAGDGADVATTANFRAVAPAGMYGTNPVTTSGLTWGYFGGTWGPGTDIANGTVVVGASATTYVVASRSTGAVSSSTGTTNWNDGSGYLRIAVLVSSASGITSITDHRPSVYNSSGGGGGSGTVTSVAVAGGVGLDSSGGPITSSGTITLDLDTATQASLALADSAVQPGDLATVATSGDAADVSIVDAGGYFTATDVEGALQELGAGGGGGGMTNPMTSAGDIIYGSVGGTPLRRAIGTAGQMLVVNSGATAPVWTDTPLQPLAISCSDLVKNLTTGTTKAYFVVPYDFTVVEVQASLLIAQASGSIFTVDINEGGVSILSTKLTIDNNEVSSITAATTPVISDASLAKGSVITIDIDQVGTAGAKGLIVYLVGRPT